MKSSKDKHILSKLIAVTLMGTVGLSMYSVSAADPAESLPLGEGSSATHESVAIGTNAQATTSSNAIGIGAKASGSSSVLGNGAQAVAGGVAIGKEAVAGIGKEGSNEIIVGGVAVGQSANAALGGIAIGSSATTKNISDVVIGSNSKNNGAGSTIIGYGTEGNRSSVVVGTNSKAGLNSLSIGYESEASQFAATALGSQSKVTAMQGVALGSSTVADTASGKTGYLANKTQTANVAKSVYTSTNGAVSVGKTNEITRQITNVAAGTEDTDVVNVRQLKDLDLAVDNKISTQLSAVNTQLDGKLDADALQYVSIKSTETGNKDNKGATGGNSIAIGPNATATAVSNVAIGEDSTAGGKGYATALGSGAKANNTGAVAIGSSANVTGVTGIAMGYEAKATGTNGVALGMSSQATSYGIAIGQAKALSQSAIALGDAANIDNASSYAIGIGDGVAVTKTKQAVVAGVKAQADNSQQVVLLGSQAKAINSGNSVVIGTSATSNSVETVAIGKGTIITDKAASALAIGNSAYIGEIKAVDPGTKPSDTANPGYRNKGTSEEIMTNPLDKSKYYFSTAVGTDAKAFGYQNTAFGAGAEAHNTNSLALGFIAVAKGDFSAAIGRNTNTDGTYATAVGFSADATGESTLALGSRAEANKASGVALGADSITNVDKGVFGFDPSGKNPDLTTFLGANKAAYDTLQTDIAAAQTEVDTARQVVVDLQNSKNGKTTEEIAEIDKNLATAETTLAEKKSALAAKVKESNQMISAWQATAAGVSVGNSETGLTRQINNVAAGTLDTDAVNVAQLKAAKVEVAAGTNITVDTDTTAGYTKYTVNSVDTDTKLVNGTALYNNDGTGSITLNTDQNGTKGIVTVTGLQDKYITGVTLQDGTLSITRNDTDTPFTVTNIATKDDVTSAIGDSAWKLGVGVASTAPNSGDATAIGTATSIKNGNEVILRADRGVKLNQVGSNIDIGLKYIDMDPATDIAPDQIVDAKASGHASLAVGQNSVVDGHQGTAVGFSTHAGQYALAAGSKADASGSNSVALGYNINVTGQGAIGIGNSKAKGSTTEEYLPKVASNFGIAIGDASYVDENSKYGTVVGPNAVITNSEKGTALGQEATIDKSIEGVALGNAAKIYSSEKGIALGSGVTVNESNNAVIIGNSSQIYKSTDSIAIGTSTAVTNSNNSVGIGNGATVNANSAVALGQNANVSARAGVALGSDSVASSVAAQGYDPLLNKKGEYYNDKIAAEYGFADRYKELVQILNNSPENTAAYSEAKAEIEKLVTPYVARAGAVSVGKEGYTRQITNVAAGLEDTDAVNVAQLKRLRATGTNYSGDDTTAIHRDLGDELTITGGADVSTAEAKAKLTTGNIGVVANDTTDGLELKLAKDINLTADGSVAFGTAGTAPKVDKTGLTVSDTIKFTNAGISAGNQTVDNVKSAISDNAGDTFADKLNEALNANANSAVNVGDLNSVTDELADKIGDANTVAESKLGKFTVGTDAAAQATGIDVDKDNTRFDILGANNNITTEIAGRQVKVGLANTLNLTDAGSISFGNGANATKVDATGLTISDKLKFTTAGISAGDQTIDNVKSAIAGEDGDKFTDKLNAANKSNPNSAVNVSDLKQTAEALAGQIGDANTAANSKLESFVVGADKNATAAGITVDKGTEGKTNRFDIVGANENIITKVTGNTIEVGLANNLNLNDGSVTTTKDGITTKVDGTGITITPSSGDTTKSVSLTNKGLNNGGNKITNVADGDLSADSKEAVNGSQLHAVKDDINKLESKLGAAGELTKVDKDGNPVVTGNDGKNYNPDDVDENGNPKDGAKPVESTLGSGADKSGLDLDNKDNSKPISADDAKTIIGGTPGADGQPGKDGLLDKTGPSLSNLATIKDLQAVAQAGLDFVGDNTDKTVHRALSQKLTINGGITDESKLTDNNIGVVSNGTDTLTVKLAKDINLGKDGSVTTGNTTINNDGLTVKGEDGKPGTTVGSDGMVVNGDDGKPATTVGKDGISTNGKDGISVNGEDGSSTTIKPDGVTSKDPNGNSTVLGPNGVEVKDKDGNTVVTINDKGISNNNGGPTNLNDGLSVPGGLVVLPGEQVNGQYVPGTGKISAEGNRIQNVAPGIAPTDAVNVGQLNGVKHDLNNRMNTIGAHAAAMAALHPMEYLEDEKLSIAAGIGTFQSKQALAVGAFYRPNDDTMFSVGGSFGGNENMFNVGVSLRVGQDSDYAKGAQNYKQAPLSTLTVLDDKVNTLEKENAALKDQLETQREQIKMLMERLGM